VGSRCEPSRARAYACPMQAPCPGACLARGTSEKESTQRATDLACRAHDTARAHAGGSTEDGRGSGERVCGGAAEVGQAWASGCTDQGRPRVDHAQRALVRPCPNAGSSMTRGPSTCEARWRLRSARRQRCGQARDLSQR
jgi:hypothetical protein